MLVLQSIIRFGTWSAGTFTSKSMEIIDIKVRRVNQIESSTIGRGKGRPKKKKN